MSRLSTAALLAIGLAAPALASAGAPIRQGGNFGLGLGGGTATSGLSAKYYLYEGGALQGTLGWWGAGRDAGGLGFDGDYLFELPVLAQTEPLDIGWNAGLGGAVVLFDSAAAVAVDGTVGLELNFNPPVPIDIVLEYTPHLWLTPAVDLDLIAFAGHVRFYF